MGGDFVPSYIVDGDHVSADAAADAMATGFDNGMYFTPQSPMFYPGAPQKAAADAAGKVTSDGPHAVFDSATGFDGSYPDAVLSSTGKPHASGVVDASAPFDSHMNMKDGYSGKGDFVPSYIVDGDRVSADAAADAKATGFDNGMYFSPQSPMFYPGAPQKAAADAAGKVTSDGPHVVYNTVPGADGSFPGAAYSPSGMPHAGGVVDASAPFDSHMNMNDGYSGKGDFVPSYIVDGDHVSADAAADAMATGFDNGMYFTPQSPMFYPGAPQKAAADAAGKVTSDGPHA